MVDVVSFKVGDRVVSEESGVAGTVSRVCSDFTAVLVKWDDSPSQQRMVEVASLKLLGSKG